jgi:hypothetical protein
MIPEMPSTSESPTIEEAIRALELAYSYYAAPRIAQNPAALASYTERSAIGWAMNPPVGSPKEQIDNLCRGAVDNLRVKAGQDRSVYNGARNLRATLRAFAGMPAEKARKPAGERKPRPSYYRITLFRNADIGKRFDASEGIFQLGHRYRTKAEANRRARYFTSQREIHPDVIGATVTAHSKSGATSIIRRIGFTDGA